jgi:hypothetical protein
VRFDASSERLPKRAKVISEKLLALDSTNQC